MTKPEQIYALFVEANPVPDPDNLLAATGEVRGPLRVVDRRSGEMQAQELRAQREKRPPRRRISGLAIALMSFLIAAVVAIGIWLASRDGSVEEAPPADQPTTVVTTAP